MQQVGAAIARHSPLKRALTLAEEIRLPFTVISGLDGTSQQRLCTSIENLADSCPHCKRMLGIAKGLLVSRLPVEAAEGAG